MGTQSWAKPADERPQAFSFCLINSSSRNSKLSPFKTYPPPEESS